MNTSQCKAAGSFSLSGVESPCLLSNFPYFSVTRNGRARARYRAGVQACVCTCAFFCHVARMCRTDVRDSRRLCDAHMRTCTPRVGYVRVCACRDLRTTTPVSGRFFRAHVREEYVCAGTTYINGHVHLPTCSQLGARWLTVHLFC